MAGSRPTPSCTQRPLLLESCRLRKSSSPQYRTAAFDSSRRAVNGRFQEPRPSALGRKRPQAEELAGAVADAVIGAADATRTA